MELQPRKIERMEQAAMTSARMVGG